MKILSQIIEGFESPFGLELLASVDWVINENKNILSSEYIQKRIIEWSKRKAKIFNREIIDTAVNHLMHYKKELGYERCTLNSLPTQKLF